MKTPDFCSAAWELNDGGTNGIARSALPAGKDAAHRYGVWLKDPTFGFALDFSTEGSFLTVQDDGADLTGDFTVSLFAKLPPREEEDRVLLTQSGVTLFYSVRTRALCFGSVSLKAELTDGLWHHILVSREGNTLTFELAGTQTSFPFSDRISGDKTLFLGADRDGGHGLDGSLAEVRFAKRAASASEMTDTVPKPESRETRVRLRHGLCFDRRQLLAPTPLPEEGQTVLACDIENAVNMGFDHVKLLLTPNHLIADDGSLVEGNFVYINSLIEEVIRQGLRCIICLHPERNFKPRYMTEGPQFETLISWYGQYGAYARKHWDPDRVALQLMTEPGANHPEERWTWMSDRMWGAVRNAAPDHTLITSSDRYGNFERVKCMSPAIDPNLIYSYTTYEPYTIGWYYYGESRSSFWGFIKDLPYPVEEGKDYTAAIEHAIEDVPVFWREEARQAVSLYVRGINDGGRNYAGGGGITYNIYKSLYNRKWHMLRAESLHDWSEKYGGIHLMVVECGCMDKNSHRTMFGSAKEAGIPDESRLSYLRDFFDSLEEYGIGYCYWSYNEAHTIFKPELRTFKGDPDYSPSPEKAVRMFDRELLSAMHLTPKK